MGAPVKKSATISECGRYRYLLTRQWTVSRPTLLYVMLNPSTADAEADDATIRSCIRLARDMDYGGIEVVNLMAWRATDPRDLPDKPSLALGAGNLRAVDAAVERCRDVVCAWGANPKAKHFQGGLRSILELHGKPAWCFGLTADGSPRHPLYVKTGTTLREYRP